MSRSILFRVMTLCLILTLLIPVFPALADSPVSSPDADGDGLPNEMETNGWYNLVGGPFYTSPYDMDSDNDSLTDSEEKLFNTNPLDDKSPGIFVKYENSFMTKEYFNATDPAYLSTVQAGDRYLMTEAMVLRRGTTFHIGGSINATLSTTSSGLTSLVSEKDPANGGWIVSIPLNAKLGTYTATLSLDTWTKSMPLYVIFELPSPSYSSNFLYNLSPEAIKNFVYDDDPADLRDETAVRYYAPEWSYSKTCGDSPCSSWQYHVTRGHAQAFWTEQFKKQAFLNYAMPSIEGTSTQAAAVTSLIATADREFRTNYNVIQQNFRSAMWRWNDGYGITMDGGACESNAAVFTTLLRSAGIPARPFLEDYNKTAGHDESGQIGSQYQYDHSVLLWLGDHWKAAQSYAGSGGKYYPWTEGTRGPGELAGWYGDRSADLIITTNEGWDWESQGGMVNDINFPDHVEQGDDYYNTWDYRWNSIRPLEIERSPYVAILNYESWYGDNWAPGEWRNPPVSDPAGRVATQTYYLPTGVPSPTKPLENWPYNPVLTGYSPSTTLGVGAAFLAGEGRAPSLTPQNLPNDATATKSTYQLFLPVVFANHSAQKASIRLGEIVSDQGVDQDGNGRFDELVVDVKVASSQEGVYQFGGWLQAGEKLIRARTDPIFLIEGTQTVQISFDGQEIGNNKANGPYQVVNLWVAEPEQRIAKLVLPEETLDYQKLAYLTTAYSAGDFEVQAASLAGNFAHRGLDTNGDGYYESLVIDVPLKISYPGTYRLEGDLYDGQGKFLGHANWMGTDVNASLQFDVAKTNPPYTLANLNLIDFRGALLDSRGAKAHVITNMGGKVYQGPVHIGAPRTGDVSVMAVTSTHAFSSTVVDTNGNGRYDQLVVMAGVNVTDHSGDYRIEGLLVDQYGTPVAWGVSDPQTLNVGYQEMRLAFDGRVLHGHMLLSPVTQTFKLIAVKIYSGNLSPATLEDQVEVALTTPAYTRNDFEPANTAQTLFADDMEQGTNKWTWPTSLWNLGTGTWRTPTHAWKASATGAASGSLSLTNTLSLNLSNYTVPALRFNNAYSMMANDRGYLEISTNGVTWTPVVTYTGSTPHWSTEVIDLSNWSGASNARFRFRANSTTKLLWYVDDVYLNAWPAVTSASFTYSPQPVRVQATTTFTASYASIDTTSPVTYTWSWGDGSPLDVTHNPSVTHQFPNTLDYIVGLTVENPYDSASISQTLHANPATDLSIAKSDSPDPVVAGNSLTYQITVTNHGPSMATDVIVTDALPSGLTLPAATPSQGDCSTTSTITCDLGSIASGADATITIVANVAPSAARTLTNTATVAGNEYDDYTTNNAATITTTVYHAPQFTSVPVTAATQDVAYTYAITATDLDAGDILVITAPTKPAWLTLTDHGNRTATLSGTPTNADVGQHAVTLLVRDTGGLTAIQPFIIAVANVNDAPQFTSEPVRGATQGVLYTYSIVVADIDAGDTVTITAPTLPGWLTFTDHHNGTATLSGTPTNDNVGPHAVTLQARDSAGAIATQSFTITVKNVNDAPTAVNDSYSTDEDTPLVVTAFGVLDNDTDPDLDPLRAILISTTSHGALTLNTHGSFVYTPTANYNGADSFTYRANDSIADSDVATVSITVNPVNDAPVAVDDEYLVVKNEVLSVNVPGVLSNDSDVEHSPLTAILVSGPAHGTLTLNANGSFTYTPDTDYVGSDSFTYQANDGTTSGNIATVTISILAEAPKTYIYLPIVMRQPATR